MKIAVTGSNGRVGKRVLILALKRGHTVLGIDTAETATECSDDNAGFSYLQADLRNFDETLNALRGCNGVVALAGCPGPGDYKAATHNTNVVISWNILRACAELGINRIAQASSINVVTMVYSQKPQYEFFPIDESHPCLPDEPYGLSKVIMETQASTIVRRYSEMRIASIRLHYSIPNRSFAKHPDDGVRKADLWGYVQEDCGADALLLAVTVDDEKWSGHEAFFVVAPVTTSDADSDSLHKTYWPNVPLKPGKSLDGKKSFFDCGKAKRLLGWMHSDVVEE